MNVPWGVRAAERPTPVPDVAPATTLAFDELIITVEPARSEETEGPVQAPVQVMAANTAEFEAEAATTSAPRAAPRVTGGRSALAVAVALAVIALIDTRAFELQVITIGNNASDYAPVRRGSAFAGIDIEKVALELDRRLPPDEPVALGPKLHGSPLLFQRMREGLYPRRVVLEARHRIELDQGVVPLHGRVRLSGPPAAPTRATGTYQALECDLGRAGLLALGFVGYAALLWVGVRRLPRLGAGLARLPLNMQLPAALLATCALLGIAAMLATFSGQRLHWDALVYGGFGALAVATGIAIIRLSRARPTRAQLQSGFTKFARALVMPELLLGCVGLALALRFVYMAPITLWDSRSVWFFLAKQLALNGRLLPEDAALYAWAHPEYPLLYPGVTAFFSALGPWDERQAAFSLFVLFGTMLALLFAVARSAIGRWGGAAFVLIPWGYLFGNSLSGYADGFVALSLLIGLFGFYRRKTEPIGWLGVWSAALIKREGLVLGLVAAALHTVLGKSARGRNWLLRIVPFLGFVPAVLHSSWAKRVGAPGDFAKAHLPPHGAEIAARVDAIWDALRNLTFTRGPASIGLAGLALAVVFLPNWHRRPGGIVALGTGLAGLAFILCAFLITPFDIRWHIQTALDRLVTQVALLLVAAGVLLTAAEEQRTPQRGAPEGDSGQG
jgi:hypothetical protein